MLFSGHLPHYRNIECSLLMLAAAVCLPVESGCHVSELIELINCFGGIHVMITCTMHRLELAD